MLDPDFVPSERYAKLLVNEIPANRRLMTCLEIFSKRSEADRDKVNYFLAEIVSVMSAEEVGELCDVISDELRQTDDDGTIRFVLGAFPADLWPRLNEIARLRVENKLIRSVVDGKWIAKQNRCSGGGLGTWATNIISQFTLKEDLWHALADKLRSSDGEQQDYVFTYFTHHAEECFDVPPNYLVWAVNRGIKAGDPRFKKAADSWSLLGTLGDNPEHPWCKPFAEALASFAPASEAVEPPEITDEDVPF